MNTENKHKKYRLLSFADDPDKLQTNECRVIQFGADWQMLTV